ncbi:MAG: hypothetical protein JW753_03550 [Dehalococcoidia bacterium]|nr:hypothetical protein [Dehalococcoidia bacterium]
MDKRPASAADSKLESLSRRELIDLVKLSSRMILALDGFWYLTVKDLAGNDKALDRDNWVWDKVMNFYVSELARLLDVKKRDVAGYMKVMHPRPEGLVLEETVEILNPNDAIRTVTYCPTIVAMEKEGEGRDAIHCSATCSEMRKKHSKLFNPAINVTCLKIPPRKSKDDIFCRFEYKID